VTIHRFFVPPEDVDGERFPIPPSIAHQVRTVLRLGDGDRIVLLTGDGNEAACRILGGECVVEERRPATGEPSHRLTIAQALLKGDALEEVVRQGTELGVVAFRLVVTDRCVVRELSQRKLERLAAIARESAEQSDRGIVPSVGALEPLASVVGPEAVLLAERESAWRLRDVPPPGTAVIGPEGGFTAAELAMAEGAGAVLAGLGPRVLRSRTVAAAVAAAVLSRTGDFA
jgi:16S rRNA (uracil1498-N3)-methyltransferase